MVRVTSTPATAVAQAWTNSVMSRYRSTGTGAEARCSTASSAVYVSEMSEIFGRVLVNLVRITSVAVVPANGAVPARASQATTASEY